MESTQKNIWDGNIWDGINFTNPSSKSAYQYLVEQGAALEQATSSELKMEVEGVNAYMDEKQPLTLVVLYKLYVVAPKLGNFRRKLLTITERQYGQRFPVDIYCHLDDRKEELISEAGFLPKINEIILRPYVQGTIVNLYNKSREI